MFERELKVYDFFLGSIKELVADIDDARLADQPLPGVNPPAWELGHIAHVNDSALALLGLPSHLKKSWAVRFGTGSQPTADRAAYPSKAELLDAVETTHRRLAEAARQADPGALDGPHPVPIDRLQKAFPTRGELLGHILTGHLGTHVGHLSCWRRQTGLPYLF